MSLHVPYNHQCPKCNINYIPYDEEVPCPNCGLIEKTRFNFIPQALESIQYNLSRAANFQGLSWSTLSLADWFLLVIFETLEAFRQQKGNKKFDAFIKDFLNKKIDWGNQKYLEKHLYSILLRIYEELPKKVFTLKDREELYDFSQNLFFKEQPNRKRKEIEQEIKENFTEIMKILSGLSQISKAEIQKEIKGLLKEIETKDARFIGIIKTEKIDKEIIKNAQKNEGVKKELIKVNLGPIIIIAVIAKKYGGRNLSLTDLIREAYFGFLKAIKQFYLKKYAEDELDLSFSIYAEEEMKKSLLKFMELEGDFRWD